ncbi:MAG: hypothetical protein H6891_04755 [Brucellaceae bacterium]|nr:hypothetical protein [Brucellaceae bacterium]
MTPVGGRQCRFGVRAAVVAQEALSLSVLAVYLLVPFYRWFPVQDSCAYGPVTNAMYRQYRTEAIEWAKESRIDQLVRGRSAAMTSNTLLPHHRRQSRSRANTAERVADGPRVRRAPPAQSMKHQQRFTKWCATRFLNDASKKSITDTSSVYITAVLLERYRQEGRNH